jgi:hypothetical protein
VPQLPVGQNKITSNVTITYELQWDKSFGIIL